MQKTRIMLLASDPHFADEDYKFGLFNCIRDVCKQIPVNNVVFTGDITQNKDNHPSTLVNRLAKEFNSLAEVCLDEILILHGNHDGRDNTRAYFKYLELMQADIVYIDTPQEMHGCLFLPHSRNPLMDWKNYNFQNRVVFAHVTVNGALCENNTALTSAVSADYFKDSEVVFSGDVHVPQTVGKVVYVGSPYHVRYGDSFKGRMLLVHLDYEEDELGNETVTSVRYSDVDLSNKFPKKFAFHVKSLEEFRTAVQSKQVQPTDLVKTVLHIDQSNIGGWQALRREIRQYADTNNVALLINIQSDINDQLLASAEDAAELEEFQAPKPKVYTTQAVFDKFVQNNGITADIAKIGQDLINARLAKKQ